MTAIAQPHRSTASPLAGIALVAALLGGMVGGALALTVPAVLDSRAEAAEKAEAALWARYGGAWEARYRQMYPNS